MRIMQHKASRISAILALSFSLGLATGCHRDPNKQKQRYLESGKRYAAEGKAREASIQFSNALRIDHNFAEAHFQLAKVLLKQGSMLQGYQELRRTIDLQPANIPARVELGQLLLAGRQPDKAAEQANAILAMQNNNPDAFSILAGVAAAKGDRAEALTQIQKAIQLDPNRSSFHATLGILQASDPATAADGEQQLRKAVSIDGKNTSSRLLLASLLARKSDYAGAEEQLKAAIADDPKNLIARTSLGDIYLRQNNPSAAEDTFRQATSDLNDTEVGASLLGNYYVRTNQLPKASSAYADLVDKHPKSVPLKLEYARILIMNKDVSKARTIGDDLAKTDSTLPDVAVLNAMILLNDNKTTDAFNLLQKSAHNNPDNVPVHLWLARAARAKGDIPTAQQSYRDILKLNPRNPEAQNGLADLSIQSHDFSSLSQLAGSAIAANPQASSPYIWRGIAEATQGVTDKADADFHKAIELDPKNSNAYLELAELRLSQKKIPEAQTLLEQALTLNPNSSQSLRRLATIYMYQKQPAKAVSVVQAQIVKSPQNNDMYDLLANLQLMTNDPNGALASAQKAMQLQPGDSAALMAYSRAQVAHGDTPAAIAKWQQWTKDHPNDAQAFTLLGALLETQGEQSQAMDSYKQALAVQPDQPVAANNLAYLMMESGQNVDVALSLAQTARRGMPNAPSTADTLAWAYYQKGNYASARDLLEDAVKAEPENASYHYHLGMTYAKLSNNTDAITHLKKAASLAPNSQTAKDADKELSQLS